MPFGSKMASQSKEEKSRREGSNHSLHWATALGLALLALVGDPPFLKAGRHLATHAERVALLAEKTARQMGLSDEETEAIYLAGLLHDIGKVETPEHILNKPAPLTDDERERIEAHPEKGREIIENATEYRGIGELVFMHHERFDGHGYPCGVKGTEIPLGARVISVADAFEAMVSDRPYRTALSYNEAAAELIRSSGRQFDPHVVAEFLKILDAGFFDHIDLDILPDASCLLAPRYAFELKDNSYVRKIRRFALKRIRGQQAKR